jgi:tRNA A37 N6-isopentenylltransferase MiaA
LNVQNQPHIDYPMTFLTAKAYLDQLARGSSLSAEKIAAMQADIAAGYSKKLHADAKTAAKAAATATPADAERLNRLAKIFGGEGTSTAKAAE